MHHKLTYFIHCMHSTLVLGCVISFCLLNHPTPTLWDMLRNFFIIIPIVIGGILIDHIKSIHSYILLSGLMVVLSYLLGTTEFEQFIYPIATFLVCYLWFRKRGDPHQYCWLTDIHFLMLFPFLLLYIVAIFLNATILETVIYYAVFLYCLCLLLHTNLNGVEKFLQKHADRSNVPLKQIQSSNDILLLFFAIITVFIFFIVPYSGMPHLLSIIGDGLWRFCKWFLALIFKPGEPIVVTPPVEDDTSSIVYGEGGKDISKMWEFFSSMFILIGILLIIIGVIGGIAILIYTLYKQFYNEDKKTKEDEDEKEFLTPDKVSIQFTHKRNDKEATNGFLDPTIQVRKLYKKSLLKFRTTKVESTQTRKERLKTLLRPSQTTPPASHFTPTEIEHDTKLEQSESAKLLHETYEKARYSMDGCTKEDITILKETLKKQPLKQK